MKLTKIMISTGLILATLTGCGRDWFNNPPPTPTPSNGESCRTSLAPVPPEFNPRNGGRPPEVPPGWRWVVISPEVRAIKAGDMYNEYCVPFSVHLYGMMDGAPEILLISHNRAHPLPYDAQLVTPWVGTYFVLAYDPSSPRFVVPPIYDIQLIATYLPERDVFGEGPLAAFRCALKVNGASVSQQFALPASTMTAVCKLKANAYVA